MWYTFASCWFFEPSLPEITCKMCLCFYSDLCVQHHVKYYANPQVVSINTYDPPLSTVKWPASSDTPCLANGIIVLVPVQFFNGIPLVCNNHLLGSRKVPWFHEAPHSTGLASFHGVNAHLLSTICFSRSRMVLKWVIQSYIQISHFWLKHFGSDLFAGASFFSLQT